jgi:hypothetical protein
MPKYSLQELLSIGQIMPADADNPVKHSKLERMYSEAQIKSRFEKYAVIVRRVLPPDDRRAAFSDAHYEESNRDGWYTAVTCGFQECSGFEFDWELFRPVVGREYLRSISPT